MTARYTHGNFDKALAAQRKYMEQLNAAKPRFRGHSVTFRRVGVGLVFLRQKNNGRM